MTAALNHAQSETEARSGSDPIALADGPRLHLGRVAQDGVHVCPGNSRRLHNDACLTFLPVHTGGAFGPRLFPIPIARGVPAAERSCRGPRCSGRVVPSQWRRAIHTPGFFHSLPAGGRSRIGACARLGRQTGPRNPVLIGRKLPATLRTRHLISAALSASRGCSEPSDVNACFGEPFVEPSHLNLRLSSVASFEKQHSERAHGTVLYLSGEFPKASGDHQHEFG